MACSSQRMFSLWRASTRALASMESMLSSASALESVLQDCDCQRKNSSMTTPCFLPSDLDVGHARVILNWPDFGTVPPPETLETTNTEIGWNWSGYNLLYNRQLISSAFVVPVLNNPDIFWPFLTHAVAGMMIIARVIQRISKDDREGRSYTSDGWECRSRLKGLFETKPGSWNLATQGRAETCRHVGAKLGMMLMRASKDDERRTLLWRPQARGPEEARVSELYPPELVYLSGNLEETFACGRWPQSVLILPVRQVQDRIAPVKIRTAHQTSTFPTHWKHLCFWGCEFSWFLRTWKPQQVFPYVSTASCLVVGHLGIAISRSGLMQDSQGTWVVDN